MALGTPVSGVAAYSAQNGTSVAPSYPAGISAGDCLVLIVGQKPSTANGGTATTPSGWTLRDSITGAGGYGTTLGADTGNTNVFVYTKDTVTGSETGTQSVTIGTNNVSWAVIVRIPDSGGTLSYGATDGQDTTAGNVSVTTAANPGFTTGDLALWAMCIPTDVTTPAQFSAHAITATGATFGTAGELAEPDSATGNDIGGFIAYASVTSGTSTAAPVITATAGGTNTNVRGGLVVLRVRETITTVNGTATVTGTSSTSNLGAIDERAAANTSTTGLQLTSQFGTIDETGTATATTTGAQATSQAASISGAGAAVGTVAGSQSASSAGTVTATGTTAVNATATATGVSASSQAGSITAVGSALDAIAGVEVTATAASISASGSISVDAEAPIISQQVTSAAGSVVAAGSASTLATGTEAGTSQSDLTGAGNANGSAAGTQATASAASISANGATVQNGTATVTGNETSGQAGSAGSSGTGSTSSGGVEATAQAGTVTANGVIFEIADGSASVTGAQATASAGTVTATSAVVIETLGGGRKRRPRTIAASPIYVHSERKNAVAKIKSTGATAKPGRVVAMGVCKCSPVAAAESVSTANPVMAIGIQNPTDEQLLMLLIA